MSRIRYRVVGRIEKTIGRRGEVIAAAPPDLPLLIRPELEVWPVPPALRGPRSLTVKECAGTQASARVSFQGIDDLNAAAGLAGRWLLARVADLQGAVGLRDRRAALGLTVIDEDLGPLGTVAEVICGELQDVWVVRGERGEVLVPVADDIITVSGTVARTRLPQGLVG